MIATVPILVFAILRPKLPLQTVSIFMLEGILTNDIDPGHMPVIQAPVANDEPLPKSRVAVRSRMLGDRVVRQSGSAAAALPENPTAVRWRQSSFLP